MVSFEIDNIKKGNIKVYEQLFKHYYKSLVLFSFRYVKNRKIAEDVVHDVFVNIWENREKLDFTGNFKSYLFIAVRHLSLKKSVTQNKFEQIDVEVILSKSNAPDDVLIKKEFEKAISLAISKLPEKRREIFCMHRFDHLTYSEIALALNISIKTVETQMGRAIKFLRERLTFLLK